MFILNAHNVLRCRGKRVRKMQPPHRNTIFHYELFWNTAETVSTWHRERNISWQTVDKFKGRGINETALFRFSYSRLVSPRRIHLFRSARQTTSCPASGRKCSSPDVADAHQQSDVTPTLFQLHCWRVCILFLRHYTSIDYWMGSPQHRLSKTCSSQSS